MEVFDFPLHVIDAIIINDLYDFPLNEIEFLPILKDASDVAIHGFCGQLARYYF